MEFQVELPTYFPRILPHFTKSDAFPDFNKASNGATSGEIISNYEYKTTPFNVTDRPQGPIFPRSKRFHTGSYAKISLSHSNGLSYLFLVFKSAAKSGPGTYGKDGIPHAALEEANRVSFRRGLNFTLTRNFSAQ